MGISACFGPSAIQQRSIVRVILEASEDPVTGIPKYTGDVGKFFLSVITRTPYMVIYNFFAMH